MTLLFIVSALFILYGLGFLSIFVDEFRWFRIFLFTLLMFMTLLLGINEGMGYPALDNGINSLPTCTLMQSKAIGKLEGENGKLMSLYAIKEREGRDRSRLYLLEDINLPILFVKTPKGEYVTYPNPGKDVLLGCGK